jgi:hypothetical protein
MLPRAIDAASWTSLVGALKRLWMILTISAFAAKLLSFPNSPIPRAPVTCYSGALLLTSWLNLARSWGPGPFPDVATIARHEAGDLLVIVVFLTRLSQSAWDTNPLSAATLKNL